MVENAPVYQPDEPPRQFCFKIMSASLMCSHQSLHDRLTNNMRKTYRTIQPSKYEGKITREAVDAAVRSLSEAKGNQSGVQTKAVTNRSLTERTGGDSKASTARKA